METNNLWRSLQEYTKKLVMSPPDWTRRDVANLSQWITKLPNLLEYLSGKVTSHPIPNATGSSCQLTVKGDGTGRDRLHQGNIIDYED